MGFDNVNDATAQPQQPPQSPQPAPLPADNEQLSVKISHGNEIRRVTLPSSSYASLVEHTVSLFGLPQANVILKYEDDDGDKISMSSDMELRESLRLAKASGKILRLFVELRALPTKNEEKAVPEQPPATAASGIYLGPQGGRFGMQSKPLPPTPFFHHPHPHPHGFHHGPPPGFLPHHPIPPHFGMVPLVPPVPTSPNPSYHTIHQPSAPVTETPTYEVPMYTRGTSTYAAPHGSSDSLGSMHEERGWGRGGLHHGPADHRHYRRPHHNSYFGSQGGYSTHTHSSGTYGDSAGFDRKAFKDNKRMMRDQWKEMKAEMKRNGNMTEEDKRRFREMKEEAKNEMRFAKKDAVMNMKAMKLSDKKLRLVARHVEDVTIPDGTELPPNFPFIKTWKIRNEGPAWPKDSQLLFVSHKGDNLNGPERVVIKGEVLPGQEVEVSVPLITPGEPGRYVGYYRMVTPDGVKFGQRVWVSFVVARSGSEGPNEPMTDSLSHSAPLPANPTEVVNLCDTIDN